MHAQSVWRTRAAVGSVLAAGSVVVIAALDLLGWSLGGQRLRSVSPGLATMKPWTAVCLLLSGSALLLVRRRPLLSRLSSLLAAVPAGFAGVEYLQGAGSGFDTWLFHAAVMLDGGTVPGRMAPLTAICLLGLAAATLTLPFRPTVSQLIGLTVTAFALIALLGYLFDVQSFYRVGDYNSVALNTAAALMLCALSVLMSAPEHGPMSVVTDDSPGGVLIRRLALPAVAFLIFVAWLRLLGQRAGWYDTTFGIALTSTAAIVCVLGLSTLTAVRLNRLALALEHTSTALEDANLELDSRVEYAGIVAHDLRNPLSVITSSLTLMARPEVGDAQRTKLHEGAEQAAHRMRLLIDDILAVARLEAGSAHFVVRPTPLDDLVRGVTDGYAVIGSGSPIVIRSLDRNLVVQVDPDQTSRVLSNLLSNALRYSPAQHPILVSLAKVGSSAEVRVQDRGPGIPAEGKSQLFQKFARLDGSGTESTGLGLFISRSLVEAQGGRISVEDTPGGGATFVVRLPLAPALGVVAQ